MTIEIIDKRIRNWLTLTIISAILCAACIVVAIFFLTIIEVENSTIYAISFFGGTLATSLIALFFDNQRRRNIQYKLNIEGVDLNNEKIKRQQFKAETRAQVRQKQRSNILFSKMRKK
jgi:hypothetical protein